MELLASQIRARGGRFPPPGFGGLPAPPGTLPARGSEAGYRHPGSVARAEDDLRLSISVWQSAGSGGEGLFRPQRREEGIQNGGRTRLSGEIVPILPRKTYRSWNPG